MASEVSLPLALVALLWLPRSLAPILMAAPVVPLALAALKNMLLLVMMMRALLTLSEPTTLWSKPPD